jgi:hypothetical protein
MSMIRPRTEVLTQITARKSDRWIARETHHGRDLIQTIRHGLSSPGNLFTLEHPLGTLEKFRIQQPAEKEGVRFDE